MSVVILCTLLVVVNPLIGAHPRPSFADSVVYYPLSVPASASPTAMVGPNVPVVGEASPDRQQVETTIAVDPRNPNILVAGAQDYRLKSVGEHRWHGYYRSTDGGQTWTSSLLPGFPGDTSPQGLTSPLHLSNATSDPVLAFDRSGNLYYAGLVFNVSAAGPLGNGPIGNTVQFVAKYVSDGATYSGVTLITSILSADEPWIAVDTTGGLHDGNVYLAFDGYRTGLGCGAGGCPFATLFTTSADGGSTFSPPFYVPTDQTGGLPGVAVDPAGNVYVSTDAFDPVTGKNLNYTQVTKITNGGTTIVQNIRAVSPAYWVTSGTDIGASFRAFTIPQIAADSRGIYLVFDDMRLGNSSVFLARSIDGGSSWTAPLRINDVSRGQHFFPTIAASGGVIDLAWYDSRLNTASALAMVDVYFADSYDGGVSFSANVRVTNVSFNPETVKRTDAPNWNEIFMGDYIGIAATPINAHALWADNRFACDTFDSAYASCVDQDAFTSTISTPTDFTISVSPTSQTILQSSSSNVTVTLTGINGLQQVNVTAFSLPTGLPIAPAFQGPLLLLPSRPYFFNITFAPNASTTPTKYSVTITGTNGHAAHFTLTTVVVQSPSVGGSLITADRLRLMIEILTVGLLSIVPTVGAFLVWIRNRVGKKGRPVVIYVRGLPRD